MGIDSTLKRFWPLVVCGLVALVAYLQAAGIGRLVGAAVADAPEGGPAPVAVAAPSSKRRDDGKPILARNPFDSVTGPLDGSVQPEGPAPDEATPPPAPADTSGDPFQDPQCGFGRVVLIAEAEDPAWSFAAIEGKSGGSKLRRRGDDVDGAVVQYVAWDRVWLDDGGKRCQLELGKGTAGAKRPAAPRETPGERPARAGRGRQLSPEIAAKINKVSETEYNVERSVVDEILENQAELMRTARIVPEKDGDKVVGIRLFGIRDGTLLNHLGLRNGDRLESINGFEMSDPQKALEAYGRLRTSDKLKVKVNRKGQPVTLDFNIQ